MKHVMNLDEVEEMRLLTCSTSRGLEIVEYPDTGKVATIVWTPGDREPRMARFFTEEGETGYWDGEDV